MMCEYLNTFLKKAVAKQTLLWNFLPRGSNAITSNNYV